ncbi:MAG: substrate-binding domain-containing protein [Desulfovibrio sp.]|jgi:DNA-binding LacI/PurR family transcriptional regulator|nr:substrate-binding domain-containing protein [Desulfovibrio sp.]
MPIDIPAEQMGREAARMLLRSIENWEEHGSLTMLETSFVPGETTLKTSA